jgi:hypothetical protein
MKKLIVMLCGLTVASAFSAGVSAGGGSAI